MLPEPSFKDIMFFFAAAITMMLGSIPQQDIFQRVMAAKDAKTASRGAIIGGVSYLLFAFVPMFIVLCAVIIMPDATKEMLDGGDVASQRILPTLILTQMPFWARRCVTNGQEIATLPQNSVTSRVPGRQ